MPRPARVFAPGVGFHVVAGTQGRESWFDDEVCELLYSDIHTTAAAAGHRLLACVIMRTHFHIIIKHSTSPLGWMMQRVMQRAAARVRLRRGIKGHVFGQRYWAEPIPTSKYLRRAIVYTHLNPCKARICLEPDQYAWSTHNQYLALASESVRDIAGLLDGLMLFADESLERADVVANYLKFIAFCQERRRAGIVGDWLLPGGLFWGDVPTAAQGDRHWLDTFTLFDGGAGIPKRTVDVREHALRILKTIDRDLDLDALRYGVRSRMMKNVLRQLICGLATAGCRPCAIARCLYISPSFVSRVCTAMRLSAIQQQ